MLIQSKHNIFQLKDYIVLKLKLHIGIIWNRFSGLFFLLDVKLFEYVSYFLLLVRMHLRKKKIRVFLSQT
jgi:hypothetical protein